GWWEVLLGVSGDDIDSRARNSGGHGQTVQPAKVCDLADKTELSQTAVALARTKGGGIAPNLDG
ncbi:MAG TPA: hypothetical protein VN888_14745, partial [Mycobacterium sp.]|nr:hypothetical protein [Mycobacterium sp.]